MSEMPPWNRQLLIVVVSQICKTIGWHTISTASLHVLVDVLHRYLREMCTAVHDHTTHFNHTMPTFEELSLALNDMSINLEDLKEYTDYVAPIPIKMKVPLYPLEKKSNLNFLKPGSREVVTRPFHIHEHLPAMRPELSDGGYTAQESANSENSALPSLTDTSTPSNFEKLGENGDLIVNKRLTNVLSENLGKSVRQLRSLMMTTSGFLSPAIEGKQSDTRSPKNIHNITKVENPVPESATVPPVAEPKSEHKKSSHSKSSSKNSEKKNRIVEENHSSHKEDAHDESRVKKVSHSSHSKKTSKSEVQKPISNAPPLELVPDPVTIVRHEKVKPPPVVLPKEPKPPKQTKAEKKLEKMQQQQQQQQQQMQHEQLITASEKLTTEPNKQKLSIFRRINKVKEERTESPSPAKHQNDKNASINESIESVIRNINERESVRSAHEKENPSVASAELRYSDDPMPNPMKKIKRKKKKKVRDEEPSAKKMKLNNNVMSNEAERPKPVVPETPHPYTFFTPLPNSLETNYLIPRFTNPFLNMTKLDPNCPHPEMPNLPLPPPMMPSTFADNRQRSPAKSVEPDQKLHVDPQELNISDKKLKKKMKKDKREKDRKKREKKEKLKLKKDLKLEEKRQDKALKKEKNKDKLKLKKKKKLNVIAPKVEIPAEDPSVPKIKLRIGGTNSPLPSPSGVPSPKINVSIVKQEESSRYGETSMRDFRESSPELARIPAFVGKPVKAKSQPKIAMESLPPAHKQVVEPITLSTKGKKATVVNSEVKSKNREKSAKSKKSEAKSKPLPYYFDGEGNQVWICPTCSRPDDGSAMIGCDGSCDAWYHWACVGVKSAPPDDMKWYCPTCSRV